MSDWKKLGSIVRCQIHTDRMVRDGVYVHDLLREVDALWLGPDGVVGAKGDEAILHAHHRLHPTRTIGATEKHRTYLPHRLLSFGFTSHYDLMAEHFGSAPLGCAGEDIIVDFDRQVVLDEVSKGVQVRRGDRVVELVGAVVAKPCVPFTKYLLEDQHHPEEKIAPHRAFIDDGIRGFIVGLANQEETVDIAVGDEFWVRA